MTAGIMANRLGKKRKGNIWLAFALGVTALMFYGTMFVVLLP